MNNTHQIYEANEAPTPVKMVNNPNAAEVVSTINYGKHEITLCDDGTAIVNGDHVCFDQIEEVVDGEIGWKPAE